MKNRICIDLSNQILGRIASFVAKQLINNHQVFAYNCKYVRVSGSKKLYQEEYKKRIDLGWERKGPFYKKSETDIFYRAVFGMLPRTKGPGKKYIKNLRVFYSTNPRCIANYNHPITNIGFNSFFLKDMAFMSPYRRYE